MTKHESLSKISKKLMLEEPFYGFYLLSLNKIWDVRIGTAGVCKNGINYQLMISEPFWDTLNEDHKTGLLKHELLHIAFGHLLTFTKFPDKKLGNIAMDMEINQYIKPEWLPEGGVDIFKIVDSECLRLKLQPEQIIHNNIILSSKPLLHTDQEINIISNMSDVCINTCCGEGFGLTTLECASLGKPIVCTGLDVFNEILGKMGNYCKVAARIYTGEREKHSGILEFTPTTEVANKLQLGYNEYKEGKLNKYKRISKNMSIKYSWESVFRKLDKITDEIFV